MSRLHFIHGSSTHRKDDTEYAKRVRYGVLGQGLTRSDARKNHYARSRKVESAREESDRISYDGKLGN